MGGLRRRPGGGFLAGHYAAKGTRKINSLLLVVSPLTMAEAPSLGAFVDDPEAPTPSVVKKAFRNKRISATEFTLLFAMLRANELIWNYWVSNYLMGETPSAFDVLYWNSDGTGMTAQFNHDFSEFVENNPFVTRGAMKVRGTPISDLADLGIDSYVLGAKNDHLCIWQSVYRSAQLLGSRSRFVLGNSGHIQTIVCPPGNPKASFSTNARQSGTPEEWLKGATRHPAAGGTMALPGRPNMPARCCRRPKHWATKNIRSCAPRRGLMCMNVAEETHGRWCGEPCPRHLEDANDGDLPGRRLWLDHTCRDMAGRSRENAAADV